MTTPWRALIGLAVLVLLVLGKWAVRLMKVALLIASVALLAWVISVLPVIARWVQRRIGEACRALGVIR